MFCSKCGDPVEQNEYYCNKCGNYLGNNPNYVNQPSSVVDNTQIFYQNDFKKTDNKKMIFIGVGVGVSFLCVLVGCVFFFNNSNQYYFSSNSYDNTSEIVQKDDNSTTKKKGKYSTVIITDNTYSGVKISSDKDAYELISEDSVTQKGNCPSEIKVIEDEIINNYGVTAVNLCEMNIDFAKEVSNVFKTVYEEYPSVRGYLTNLTLVNASLSDGYIAAFMPIFNFATSDSESTYPWVIKTQVLLNTTYFLNIERLEASVQDASKSGHFPPNTTKYSPVAHELGHYLSFLAQMKSHGLESILLVDNNNINSFYDVFEDFAIGDFSLKMIKEAYDNCKTEKNISLSFDEWRATISDYAVAKDNSGNYIYDETIAEAFHDVYLNGTDAKDASKYIIAVLKNKLEG